MIGLAVVFVIIVCVLGGMWIVADARNQAIMLQAQADVMRTEASQDFWLSLMPWFLLLVGLVVVGTIVAVWLNSRKRGDVEIHTTNNVMLIGPGVKRHQLRQLAVDLQMPELVEGNIQKLKAMEERRFLDRSRNRELPG